MLRWLFRAVRVLLVLLLALGAALACWIRFVPDHLLGRALVALARGALELPELDLDALDLRLGARGRLTLRGLVVGPPPGFTLPTLTLDRLALHYDLRRLLQGVITIERFELVRPIVRLEQRGQRLSWLALATGRGGVAPAVAVEPAPAPAPSTPLPLDLRLQQVRVEGMALYFDDGARRVVVDGLGLSARARLVSGRGQARVVVALAPPPGQTSSVAVAQHAPAKLRATLDTRLRAVLDLEALAPLRAALTTRVEVRTRTLVAPWAVPPTTLSLRCDAEVDQEEGWARLQRLTLALNGQRLLRLKGRVEALGATPRVQAELARLLLPLATLLPYARLAQPALRASGSVAAEGLRAELSLPATGPPQLRAVTGRVALRAIDAALPTASVAVRGLDGALSFDLVSGRGTAASRGPRVQGGRSSRDAAATLRLALRELRAGPNAIDGLVLDATGAVDLLALRPRGFDGALALHVVSLGQRHPRFGWVRTRARLSARLTGDADARRAELASLRLELGRHLRLGLRASTPDWATAAGSAHLTLDPLALAGLWQELPAALRRTLPLDELAGELRLDATIEGRAPAAGSSPLRWPLRLGARLGLRGLRFAQRTVPLAPTTAAGGAGPLRVTGLDGELVLRSRAERATLDGRLRLATLDEPASGLRLRELTVPLALTLTTAGVSIDSQPTLAQLEQTQPALALHQRGLALRAKASAALPVERLLAGRAVALERAGIELSVDVPQTELTQPGLALGIERGRARLAAEYDPRRVGEPLRWQARLGWARLHERVQRARVEALALGLRGVAGGWSAGLPAPGVTPAELWAGLEGELTLGRVEHPALLRPLAGTRLELAARLRPAGPFALQRLRLRVPTLGLSATLGATLDRPWELVANAGGLGRGSLPPFELHLDGELRSPSATKAAAARPLHQGLRSAGMLGAQLQLRAVDVTRLRLEGRLLARDFSLWLDGAPQPVPATGTQAAGWLRSRVHLAGLNAAVPLAQELVVGVGAAGPTLALPPAGRSIFGQSARGAAYRLVRPFVGGRADLSFDGLTLRSELREGAQDVARVRSQQELHVGRTVLDLALRDGTLWLNHLAVEALGGDLVGDLQLQVLRLRPLDLRVRADTRLTNIDLARLDPEAVRRGRQTRFSALVALNYELSRQALSGQLLLQDLSLDTLDALLAYLDPHGLDPAVQANRGLINAWYTRWTRPEVERVALWIAHSQLNLDIRLGAVWPLGAVLRRALHGVRIRRVSLRPFLPAGDDLPPPASPLPPARPAEGQWEPPVRLSAE